MNTRAIQIDVDTLAGYLCFNEIVIEASEKTSKL